MRCPQCQATNPDGAAFCGQCHLRFDTLPSAAEAAPLPRRGAAPVGGAGAGPVDEASPGGPAAGNASPAGPVGHASADEPAAGDVDARLAASWLADLGGSQPAEPSAAEDPTTTGAAGPEASGRGGAAPEGDVVVRAGRFRAAGDTVGWSCAICEADNDLSTFSCTTCGSRMDAEPRDAAEVDWDALRRAEALVPGLGHLRAGATGVGAARLGISGMWLLGALLLALGGLNGLLVATPLVAGIGVLMFTGPGDLDALRVGRPPRLDARRFGMLVVAVTVGVIAVGGMTVLR